MSGPTGGRRAGHLVGSIPGERTDEVMREAMGRLGPYLRTLPDGETGVRRDYLGAVMDNLRRHPDLETRAEGSGTEPEDRRFKVRKGRTLHADTLDLGIWRAFTESFAVFERLRSEFDRDDLAFQVGVPSDFNLAAVALGPMGAVRHRRPFAEATAREMSQIYARAGEDAVFQIELPAELVTVAKMPRPLQPVTAGRLARGVARLIARVPAGVRCGVHLCLGDRDNRAEARLRDAAPLVHLINAITRRWPAGRPLEYVHVPFAAGRDPAPRSAEFYRPLSGLRLPETVRFVAGLVHEGHTVDELRDVLRLVEGHLDRRVDVAAPCGLGRRAQDVALATMDQTADLCEGAGRPRRPGA